MKKANVAHRISRDEYTKRSNNLLGRRKLLEDMRNDPSIPEEYIITKEALLLNEFLDRSPVERDVPITRTSLVDSIVGVGTLGLTAGMAAYVANWFMKSRQAANKSKKKHKHQPPSDSATDTETDV
jgi:hypothetical protein